MSKNIDDKGIVTAVATVASGVQGLIVLTRTQKGLDKVLADTDAKRILTGTMKAFIDIDVNWEGGMKSMGEVCTNLLAHAKKNPSLFEKAIAAICEYQDIPMIAVNEKAPRNTLASALFAKYPDMMRQVKGGNDTVGAQRISGYMLAFKGYKQKRIASGNGTSSDATQQPRSASDLFVRLYTAGSAKDQQVLVRVAGKAGIEFEDWIKEDADEGSTD